MENNWKTLEGAMIIHILMRLKLYWRLPYVLIRKNIIPINIKIVIFRHIKLRTEAIKTTISILKQIIKLFIHERVSLKKW